MEVSVPLRGKYRGEYGILSPLHTHPLLQVSVPLRGKYRGEFVIEDPTYVVLLRFRPLAG